MWPESTYVLEGRMLSQPAVWWRDQAAELEAAVEASFDVEEIRLLNAYRRVVDAVAVWRQTYSEVTG